MFSHILSTGEGWVSLVPGSFQGSMPGPRSLLEVDLCPRGGYPTLSLWTWDLGYHGIRSASGRYTSYWYAFLLINNFSTNLGLKISLRVNTSLVFNTCGSILALLSGWGGGNGVYFFLVFFLCGCFRLLRVFALNFGKKRSHDSSFSSGSFASSCLIIKV